MLLTDVGNTETVLGVFDGPELAQTWRLSTQPERSADELALVFAGLLEHRGLSLEKLSASASPRSFPTSPTSSASSPIPVIVPAIVSRGRGPACRYSPTTRARSAPTGS